jgi:hypothetical protein
MRASVGATRQRADSTTKCVAVERSVENLLWRAQSQPPGRSLVELVSHFLDIDVGVSAQIAALGQVPPDQIIGIFVGAVLPGCIGLGEVAFGVQGDIDHRMLDEFTAAVPGQICTRVCRACRAWTMARMTGWVHGASTAGWGRVCCASRFLQTARLYVPRAADSSHATWSARSRRVTRSSIGIVGR